jgi:precorrin-6A synthase
VIPGVSSLSVLAAQHRTAFNRIGKPVQITTGRRLAEGFPADADDVLVMLDATNTFTKFPDMDVFWGAYLGTPDEILVSGKVSDVADEIVTRRAEARERKGWIMDTYLLRRT